MAEPAVAGEYVRQRRDGVADAEGLWRLFESAHAGTQASIVDYAERARAKGAVVRRLRLVVVSLFILGASAPALAGQLSDLRDMAAIGYALLTLADGLALIDQVFGLSRSWTRCRQAQARLEALAVSLRYAWAARLAKSGGAISDAVATDLAALILTHLTAIEALTEAETGMWVEHLRARLAPYPQAMNSPLAAPWPPRA